MITDKKAYEGYATTQENCEYMSTEWICRLNHEACDGSHSARLVCRIYNEIQINKKLFERRQGKR